MRHPAPARRARAAAAAAAVCAARAASAAAPCAGDAACHLNGRCDSGRCECDAGWAGDDCSVLDIVPGPVLAYAHADISSWGGSVAYDPTDGLYHMFVAEVAGGCGMWTWIKNERIAHATSKDPAGPFVRRGVVGGPMWDNPQVLRLPNGTWALWHDVRWIHSDIYGPCDNGNGTTPPAMNRSTVPHEPVVPPGGGGSLHVADSPYGPWRGVPFNWTLDGTTRQCPTNPGASSPEDLDFRDCFNNPAPFLLPDGRFGVVRKSRLGSPLQVLVADDLAGPYVVHSTVTGPGWNTTNYGDAHGEDPFAWVDARGWHVVTHQGVRSGAPRFYSGDGGRHMYSADGGLTWTPSNVPAFGNMAALPSGEWCTSQASQRPFLLRDPTTGAPTHLYTSHDSTNCTDLPSGSTTYPRPKGPADPAGRYGGRFPFNHDWSFTAVRAIRRR